MPPPPMTVALLGSPTSNLPCVRGSIICLTIAQIILKTVGALMMQMWPSISG